MVLLVCSAPVIILLITLFASLFGGAERGFRWWFPRIGLVPLICACFAVYIVLFPREIPVDWDPMVDPNYGRLDFVAALFWGIVAPSAYLIAALPITTAWLVLRKTK